MLHCNRHIKYLHSVNIPYISKLNFIIFKYFLAGYIYFTIIELHVKYDNYIYSYSIAFYFGIT